MKLLCDLKNPPKAYRPIPFWSWNDRLEPAETKRQVELMDEAGLGGFFMHARGGLQTDYMGEEWMDNIRAACEAAAERGMGAWGYDENGWPSGFGNGIVNGMGTKNQQKYLRCCQGAEAPCPPEQVIGTVTKGDSVFTLYYDINPFYVDTLDKAVTLEFIRAIHETYKKELGENFCGMAGFFTDEPQISRNGIPWSLTLPDEYRARYGEELLPVLPELFEAVGSYEQTRTRYWALVRDLFCDHFLRPIYDWCEENNLMLTGHLVLEETMFYQLTSNGACMPGYEYFHIPGMDWLGRGQVQPLTVLQLASVAQQTGKKQVLSETFALCGWDVDFEELRRLYESQMVRGVNLLCQHLEGYTLRGIRKRDYPATLFFQQPWWEEYGRFNDAMSRIGYLLTEGEPECGTLLLHPQETAWTEFNNSDNGRLHEFDARLAAVIDSLEARQIPFHLGDERMMQLHGSCDGGAVRIGQMRYTTVLVPPSRTYSKNTLELLQQFRAAGGQLVFFEEVPTMVDGVADDGFAQLAAGSRVLPIGSDELTLPREACPYGVSWQRELTRAPLATSRKLPGGWRMIYVVNREGAPLDIAVRTAGCSAATLCYDTGDLQPVAYTAADGQLEITCTLPANGSAVLLVSPQKEWDSLTETAVEKQPLPLPQQWQIAGVEDNALVLDHCDCYVDGELLEANIPVIDIQDKLCAYGRAVDVVMEYHFHIQEKAFSRLQLVLETPSVFTVTLNGNAVDLSDTGYYRDRTFRTVDVYPYAQLGDNHLQICCRFEQTPATYQNVQNAQIFESELNKLSYDMEIEVPMLIGDFGVYTDSEYVPDIDGILRAAGPFRLTAQPTAVHTGALCTQGFPFFCGRIRLTGKVCVEDPTAPYAVMLKRLGATAAIVRVNGKDAGSLHWSPYTLDVSGLLQPGDNEIEVELVTSLRNLMGPFHQPTECHHVCPGHFFRHSPLWGGAGDGWNPAYLFAEHGVFPTE